MVYNSNPMVVCPEQEKVARGLAREDLFTVVSDHFLTDTARYADIVLPATTQLEQLDIMFSWGHFYVSLNTPAIAPLGEAVPNTELFRRLAARMGFTEECFTRTDEEMVADAFDWTAAGDAGHHRRVVARDGGGRASTCPRATSTRRTPRATSRRRRARPSSARRSTDNFVSPLFRQGSNEPPARRGRSTRCRTTSRRGRPPTAATGST